MKQETRLLRAIALADQLVRATDELPDGSAHALAVKVRHILRPQMDMKEIIARVPGDTLRDRAKRIEVSRMTLYNWLTGKGKPDAESARKLAAITGISADVIQAR